MKKLLNYTVMTGWLVACALYSEAQITVTTEQAFHSPNAKIDSHVTPADMIYLDYKNVFYLKSNMSAGIIGDVSSGGEIRVKVYAYDESKSDGKGKLIYGVYNDATIESYNHSKVWNEIIAFTPSRDGSAWPIYAQSNDIKKLAQQAHVYLPAEAQVGCGGSVHRFILGLVTFSLSELFISCKHYREVQPVIIEVTVKNATFNKLRVPGIGEFDAAELFYGGRPIAQVNGKVTLGSHRGNWQDVTASENTKNSIRDMLAEHYDMVELDLWRTLDDKIIVFHDMGLRKRTIDTGGVRSKTWSQIQNLYIKNRFDELIQSEDTKIELLSDILDYIKQNDPQGKVALNLDRSANDMHMFKLVYQEVSRKGMLDRAIFKGRFNPEADANGEIAPTVATIKQAFLDMYPSLTIAQRNNKMKMMHFTPILFDNQKGGATTNDETFAARVKEYIDDMIGNGIADGFELNFKSYPIGSPAFANQNNDFVFLLKKWQVLGNMNFVEYVHAKNLPVGIFASVPEVCAIPDFASNGTRDTTNLVSGFVKEDLVNGFLPRVKQQGDWDFRGDWDFYIPAGVDFVITDRPDALREYLKAIGRFH